MPIFEYKCSKCGSVFEFLVRDGEKASCPKCGSKRLRKLVSAFSPKSPEKTCACKGENRNHSDGCCGGGHHCCGGGHCGCGHCG